jgi:hypothetical protein
MGCIIDSCNPDNPYGFCNGDSFLTLIWFIPFMIITSPIWLPIILVMCCSFCCYEQIMNMTKWSYTHRNNYEVIQPNPKMGEVV